MRFSAVVALFSAGLASAALLPRQDLPSCAQTCIGGATTQTTCDLTDNACLCADAPFVNTVTECITTTCTGDDLVSAVAAAQAMCADSGVTLTESSTATGSTTSATGTASTTGTGSTTTSPATSASSTATAPATTSSTASGNSALSNGVSAAAGIAAVVLGAIAL